MEKMIRLLLVSCLFIVLSNLFACQQDSDSDPQQNTNNTTTGTWDSGKWDQAVWQ